MSRGYALACLAPLFANFAALATLFLIPRANVGSPLVRLPSADVSASVAGATGETAPPGGVDEFRHMARNYHESATSLRILPLFVLE